MINQEVKLKNILTKSKTDFKKRGNRKSMCQNFPKHFLFGKGINLHLSNNKKNELNKNNNNINLIKRVCTKNFERKYSININQNKIKEDIIKINLNSINKNKNYTFIPKTNYTLHQLEKNIFKKFYTNYNKYYLHDIKKNNENEKISIYEYFQGNNMILNKKCKIKLYFQEYIRFFNLEEYIMDYFSLKECNYVIRFLLFFIYNRDIYVINYEEEKIGNKTLIFRSFIKTMIQRIEKFNNFQASILNKLLLNIKDIYNRLNRRESLTESLFYINKMLLNNSLNPILGKKIKRKDFINSDVDYSKYLGVLIHLQLIKINAILPNSFCFGYKLNFYLHDFLKKRKRENIIEIFFNEKQKTKIMSSKRPSKSKKNNYNKSFYDVNILQEKNSGLSFVTMEELNNKLEEDKFFQYFLNQDNKKYLSSREANDPEIKDIQLFLNNFENNNKTNIKKTKSIKFTMEIKKGKKKDALLDKMLKRKSVKSSSYKKDNRVLFSSLKNKLDKKNVFIIKNLNNQFDESKNKSNISENNRKLSFRQNSIKSFDERKTNYMSKINNNLGIFYTKLKPIKSTKIINQYSFKYKENKTKEININNNNENKDSLILVPKFKASSIKNLNNKKYSLTFKKSSISSLSSSRYSIKKNDSAIIKHKKEKDKKSKFKQISDFIKGLTKKSSKYDIKNILLENIESINNDPNNKYYIEYKDYFRRRNFRYLPPKYFESDDNVWKEGELRDSRYKSNYEYNLLMMKIEKEIKKGNDKYKNLLEKEINIRQISKSADIYL